MNKKLLAFILIGVVVVVAFVSVNPINVLVVEVACDILPRAVSGRLKDVEFIFSADSYLDSVPTHQFMSRYSVASGTSKLSFWDIDMNLTLTISIFKDDENGSLWRSVYLLFSTVMERKIQIYMQRPSNVSIGNVIFVEVQGRFVVWEPGQTPHIDKVLHKTFTLEIPLAPPAS